MMSKKLLSSMIAKPTTKTSASQSVGVITMLLVACVAVLASGVGARSSDLESSSSEDNDVQQAKPALYERLLRRRFSETHKFTANKVFNVFRQHQRRLRPPGAFVDPFRGAPSPKAATLNSPLRYPSASSLDDKQTSDVQLVDTTDVTGSPTTSADVIESSRETGNETVTVGSDGKPLVQRLPQAIIIGVKKGGTRALLEFLRIHPDIRAPGPEVHFFDRFYHRGLDWYRSQMPPTADGQVTIEKTPSYFVTKAAPERVYNMSRDVRLIVVVRDPVTRAISDYAQAVAKRPDLPPFDRMAFLDAIFPSSPGADLNTRTRSQMMMTSGGPVATSWGAVKIGLYARHLERWMRYFPPSQFHFVHGERLISDPAGELALLQDFLGLRRHVTDRHFYFNATKGFPCLVMTSPLTTTPEPTADVRSSSAVNDLEVDNIDGQKTVDENPLASSSIGVAGTATGSGIRCLGKTKGRTHPVVDETALRRLRDFFRPFNEKFYRMSGIDFGWQ